MVTIAHISDLHCTKKSGIKEGFYPKKLDKCVKEINKLCPDVVVVTGDLTVFGFRKEYELAKKYLSKIKAKKLIIPGNHDSRYCGYKYFDELFGHGNNKLELPGIGIIGVDTTVPDLDSGNIGRGKLRWLTEEIQKIPNNDCKIIAMHHHLVSVPGTGRERSTIHDAGTVLEALVKSGVDLVLCGHKHTPYSWLINGVAIVNAGSASAIKLRANINNNYNIIEFAKSSIKIFLKEIGKKPELMAEYATATSKEGLYVKRHKIS
ncbi:metallophosphoesterase [Candidatus Woesearchaeota archaeon]|nr:metallophosphoesterase [Candidatus Woesearchaeota archaeon]